MAQPCGVRVNALARRTLRSVMRPRFNRLVLAGPLRSTPESSLRSGLRISLGLGHEDDEGHGLDRTQLLRVLLIAPAPLFGLSAA